ncbi:unnamed protein product [Leptosia nina]|uniref:Uncharacterized protein n=1 Tax=Leptosia nina TaxID=320188 RepID=A0AAV1IY91_9NEOP
MVKFGKNKLKMLNKLEKRQNAIPSSGNNNKILKKKINAARKVAFQKDVLREMIQSDTLVTHVSKTNVLNAKNSPKPEASEPPKTKIKAVEKQKRRQKMQVSDTKLLLSLMKKKN